MNAKIKDELDKLINEQEENKYLTFFEKIKEINNKITYKESINIYNIANSIRNSKVSIKGKIFENIIENILINNKINFTKQTSIDIINRKFSKNKSDYIIDFVIYPNNVNIYTLKIEDCIILSCKYTCREHYKEDDKIISLNPFKYYLLVATNDYPKKFIDDDNKKLITMTPKENDTRTTFDNFLNILNKDIEVMETIYKTIRDDKQREIEKDDKKLTFIDLCCGIGSFHYSMVKNNKKTKCILACDILKTARETYKNNYNIEPMCDLKDINYNEYDADILFSGNPCQAFSQIGKRKGFEDERGDLFNFILDNIVSLQKYNIIVFENVYGLYTHDNGNTLKYIIDELNKYNYKVVIKILLCSNYGIPQNRKRVFIICLHSSKFDKDIKEYENILDNILNNHINKNTTLTTYLNNGYIFDKKIAYTIRCGGIGSPIDSKQNWDGYYVKDSNGKRYEYRLSVKDMKLLQGFDKMFKLIGTKNEKKKLLGNSIPTNLTSIITEFINEIY